MAIALTVVTALKDLENVRDFWERAQGHPNIDFVHFRLVCEQRPDVIAPHVVALSRGGDPSALLVARRERRTFVPAVGYLQMLRIPATVLTVLHQGVIGELEHAEAQQLVRHLWEVLKARKADAVEFVNQQEGSPLIEALVSVAPRGWFQPAHTWSEHWTLQVPEGPGGLAQKMRGKHRNWLRKKENALEDAFQGKVQWPWLQGSIDVLDLCTRLEEVASRTYQRGLGAGFNNTDEFRKRLEVFASRGQLRVQLLEIGGEVRAFWFGTVYGSTFHSWATAYDPDLREYEPGNLMFLRLVDHLGEERIKTFDFGLGDAFYKKRFGDSSWREGTCRLYAPSVRGALLRSTVTLSTRVDKLGRKVLNATGMTDRFKAGWRRRLAASAPQNVQHD